MPCEVTENLRPLLLEYVCQFANQTFVCEMWFCRSYCCSRVIVTNKQCHRLLYDANSGLKQVVNGNKSGNSQKQRLLSLWGGFGFFFPENIQHNADRCAELFCHIANIYRLQPTIAAQEAHLPMLRNGETSKNSFRYYLRSKLWFSRL